MDSLFLHRWMTHLDPHIRNSVPIIYLAIPGSSNSMSYSICWRSFPAPATSLLKRLVNLMTGKLSVARCKRQTINVYEQLRNGIRYFDLKICKRSNSIQGIYFCCGRYCDPIIEPIAIIRKYLQSHPKEFVLLDFRKFYNMTRADHNTVQEFLRSVFGLSIFGPRNGLLAELTLNKAMRMRKQILIIYRNENRWENAWTSSCWPVVSAKTENIEYLSRVLELKLRRRSPGIGCIARYVFKPKSRATTSHSRAARHIFSGNKNWIPRQSAGFLALNLPQVNIITADFIETSDSVFCRDVVSLNWSLWAKSTKYGLAVSSQYGEETCV